MRPIPRTLRQRLPQRIQWLGAIGVLAIAGCAAPSAEIPPTLYQRLGGEAVVTRVVAQTIDRTAADPRTARSFKDVKLARVKEKIVEQICSLAGGGCRYTGDSMEQVHKGLGNTEAELNLLVQNLRDALDDAGVEEREKNELLRLLASLKRDIVTQ